MSEETEKVKAKSNPDGSSTDGCLPLVIWILIGLSFAFAPTAGAAGKHACGDCVRRKGFYAGARRSTKQEAQGLSLG